MEPALPLKSVVLFIACGTMVFIIVFIFAKRQITRFALRSNRGPHATIGADAPKSLRQEIERCLKRVAEITYEPKLLSPVLENTTTLSGETCSFHYRMKAIDNLTLLDEEFKQYSPNILRNRSGQSLRMFLLDQRQRGPLQGVALDTIESYCNAYDHARHDPMEFNEVQYQEYMGYLNQLMTHIRNKKNLGSSKEPLNKEAPPISIQNIYRKHSKDQDGNNDAAALETTDNSVHIMTAKAAMATVGGASVLSAECGPADDCAGEEGIQITYRPVKRDMDETVSGPVRLRPRGDSSATESSQASNLDSSVSSAKTENYV